MNILKDTREEVLSTARKIMASELNFGTWGNISCRRAVDKVIITPSGIPYSDLGDEDICMLDLQGQVIDGCRIPSTELPLHLAIYRAREDIQAIVHVHSKYASAFAVTRQEIPVALEEMAQLLGGVVPIADYALPGSDMLGDKAVTALGEGYAVLLASHGLVAVGSQLEEALLRCLVIERSARVLLLSRLLGPPVLLEQAEIIALREKYTQFYGQERKKD